MFIRRLTISSADGVLRDIQFHEGLNLIVDQTPLRGVDPTTGNNVGKTTVLKLVDFCLGADAKIVYAGPEGKSSEYRAVRDYLEDRNVEVELELVDDLGAPAPRRVVVQRSFVPRGKRALRRINGEDLKKDEFDTYEFAVESDGAQRLFDFRDRPSEAIPKPDAQFFSVLGICEVECEVSGLPSDGGVHAHPVAAHYGLGADSLSDGGNRA